MSYITIKGYKYEKDLIELARNLTSGRGEYQISKEEVLTLFEHVRDGRGETEIEKRTLTYIRNEFQFTEAAKDLFDEMISE
jgi:hypothetical protein